MRFEKCRAFCKYFIVSQFKKEVHFSGTFEAVKIAGQFVTIWFIATCKTTCNSQWSNYTIISVLTMFLHVRSSSKCNPIFSYTINLPDHAAEFIFACGLHLL